MNQISSVVARFLCICVFGLSAFYAHCADVRPKDNPQRAAEPLNKVRESEWKDVTVQLHLTGVTTLSGGRSEQVRAKKANYSVLWPGDLYERVFVPVTVFVTSRGEIWAGLEENVYIETELGVIGASLDLNDISWSESAIRKRTDGRCDIAEALDRFMQEVSESDLQAIRKRSPSRTTDLTPLTVSFGAMANNGCEKISSASVTNGILRADFKSVWRDEASAWIDIKTKKVVKAVFNGKQVFPK